MKPRNAWSPEDVTRLKIHYAATPQAALIAMFNRSKPGIQQKARALGLAKSTLKLKRWTVREVNTLTEMYGTSTSTREMANQLDRPLSGLLKKAQELGLRKKQRTKRTEGSSSEWQASADEYLKLAYSDTPISAIANHLGRTAVAVYARAHILGLKRSNSGRLLPLGSERQHFGRRFRKVASTGDKKIDWKRVDVIEWEAVNGRVPEGMMLVKTPGKPRAIHNLKLVPSESNPLMAARKNSTQETRRLWDLQAQFGSALSRIEKYHPTQNTVVIGKAWEEFESEYLRAHNESQTTEEIATALGRPKVTIQRKRRELGLSGRARQVSWSEEDLQKLIAMHPTMSNGELADLLGRDKQSIINRAARLGLARRKGKTCPN